MTKAEYLAEHEAQDKITSLSKEKRVFQPKAPFSHRAHIKSMAQYTKMYNESVKNPEKFWAKEALRLDPGNKLARKNLEIIAGAGDAGPEEE